MYYILSIFIYRLLFIVEIFDNKFIFFDSKNKRKCIKDEFWIIHASNYIILTVRETGLRYPLEKTKIIVK